jgi:hypothetical protein
MTALLLIHVILALFAVRRGWRVAPFVLLALPRLFAELEPALPEFALAGWIVPFANLLLLIGGVSTCCLLYTAIAEPEPA